MVQRVGRESASLQAVLSLCSSRKDLMCRILPRTGESNYFISYKRLGAFAKLATTYTVSKVCAGLPTRQDVPKAVSIVSRRPWSGGDAIRSPGCGKRRKAAGG